MSTLSHSQSDISPRVNRKVNENTKMNLLFDKQDTESEDDTYSFEQEIQVPSSLLEGNNEYHAYSDNTSYHPTSLEDTSVHFQQLTDTDSISAEEALYTASVFSKQAKKSVPHALAPPSHNLKARRLSKTVDESSSVEMSRKRSIVNDYQKELANHSAVSPRFMTLRKLSEVTALPAQPIETQPPVPLLPSSHLTPASSPPMTHKVLAKETNDLSGIDSIIEAQLQYHLGQMAWRVSESHVEARRFWEEQKNQVFGFASTMIDRIEREMQSRLSDTLDLKRELDWHRQQLAEKQCQLHELEILRIRNSELEKQHELDVTMIQNQQMDKDRLQRRLSRYEDAPLVKKRMSKTQHASNWAEMMESEDEVNKKVEVWVKKYKDLERNQQDMGARLERERSEGEELRIELENLKVELGKKKHCACCKFQKPETRNSSQGRAQSFIAQDGYLTFTAEINGQLSKYSVKIPKEQAKRASLNPNAPPWRQAN